MLVLSLFVALFLLYLQGVSPSVFGGDSGDIILSAYYAGIAHPQGYPLNSLIGWIFTHLPYQASIAFKANLMSAFFQSLSVMLVFLILRNITKNAIISLAGALTLAFTPLIWLYAHLSEVFQLTVFLVALTFYFLLKWLNLGSKRSNKENSNKFLYLAFASFGFAFFHHFLAILFLPVLLFLLFKKRRELMSANYARLAASFLFGFIPYLAVPLLILKKPIVNWAGPLSFNNLFRLITRADYGFYGDFPEMGLPSISKLIQLQWFSKVVLEDFTMVGIIFVVVGVFYLFQKNRELLWLLLLSFFFTGPFFVLYISFIPTEVFILAIMERFLLISYFFLAIFLGIGMYTFYVFFVNIFNQKNKLFNLLCQCLFLLVPFSMFFLNYPKTDLSSYVLGDVFGKDILSAANPAGLILLQGDTTTFNARYSHYVDNESPSSIIVMTGRLKRPAYRAVFKEQNPNLQYPADFDKNVILDLGKLVPNFIEENKDLVPIFSNVKAEILPENYIWVQEGFLNRAYPKDRVPSNDIYLKTARQNFKNYFENIDIIDSQYSHYMSDHIKSLYSEAFVNIGDELKNRDLLDEAQEFYFNALHSDKSDSFALIGLGDVRLAMKDCGGAKDFYLKSTNDKKYASSGYISLGNLYKECYKDNERADFFFRQAEKTNVNKGSFKNFELF